MANRPPPLPRPLAVEHFRPKHGRNLKGYVFLDRLGGGGFGEVWKMRANPGKNPPKFVACKLAKVPGHEKELRRYEDVKKFREALILLTNEDTVLSRLRDSDFVVNLHRSFAITMRGQELTVAFIQELMGGDLVKLRAQYRAEFYAWRIWKDMLHALSHLHEEGFIHCDVKPDNILYDRAGPGINRPCFKLADFGLVCSIDKPRVPGGGTAGYMAPEIVRGKSYDSTVDTYALMCTMIFFIEGDEIYDQDSTDPVKANKAVWDYVTRSKHLRAYRNVVNIDPDERPSVRQLLELTRSDSPKYRPFTNLCEDIVRLRQRR